MKSINFLFVFFFAVAIFAQDVSVTIYNDNFAVVREKKKIQVEKGISTFRITDIPSAIEPASVKIKFDGEILEQNYKYDLADKYSVLRKYLNKKIKLTDEKGNELTGKLISGSGNGFVLEQTGGGLLIISNPSKYNIALEKLPENFVITPTLEYLAKSKSGGKKEVELSYFTGGISWTAEYVAVLNENDSKMDLNSWVTLTNNSGGTFRNAKIKLVAGNVNRVRNAPYPVYAMEKTADAEAENFNERNFFEYHIYELARQTTIANKESKQIAFFDAENINVKKRYVFRAPSYTMQQPENVSVLFDLKNTEGNNLGKALPKGKIKLFKKDNDDLEFIGEDEIPHTAKGETIHLRLGKAFDVKAQYREINRTKIAKNVYETEGEVKIHNGKNSGVTVEVIKNFSGDWEILRSNVDYAKVSSGSVKFIVKIPRNNVAVLKFKVRLIYN